jgi:hypothetical protein
MDWNWSLILNAAVSLVCGLILTVCVPLLKARLGEERFQTLQNRVAICVAAAEQLFGSGEGQKKKDYVLSLLLSRGLVKDVDDVTALIESEVYRLQNNG